MYERRPTPSLIAPIAVALVAAAALAGPLRAADSAPPCTVDPSRQRVAVALDAPDAQAVVAVRVSLAYDPAALRLPELGGGDAVRARLTPAGGAALIANNVDRALHVVASKPAGLTLGPLFQVDFDRCTGVQIAAPRDLQCVVDSCASVGGPLDGCTCTATLR